jgi:ABC-type sugar transport system substrate-binding protein
VARVRTGVRALGAVLAAVLGASLAGCSSTGGKRAADERAAKAAAGGAAVTTPRWTFAMVTHSGDGDTFWDIVQSGAEQAAVKDNINFLYSHSDEGQQQAQLVQTAIEAKLQADRSIDSVVTLGAPFADAAVQARKTAQSTAEVDTFDLNPKVAAALQAGTLGFAVDQQPYLQGYQAVDLLWLYKYNADVLGGGRPVLTGPQIITEKNAAELEEYTERGTR